MDINLIYDSSVAAAPAGFKSALTYAVGILESLFSNPITINIQVGYGEVAGQVLGANDLGEGGPISLTGYSYDQARSLLANAASSSAAQTAVASLAGADPTHGGGIEIGGAEAKALGLISASGGEIDGAVGFASAAGLFGYGTVDRTAGGKYDFVGVALHELTHAMGRISLEGQGGQSVLDLYRYSAPGARDLTGNQTDYFSIDGGLTNIENFASSGDLGDWAKTAISDANSAQATQYDKMDFSSSDIEEMNVLGFALANSVTGFVKVGDDKLVNTATYYGQFDPSIARLNNGDVIISFTDFGVNGLRAQLFSASDSAVGAEQSIYASGGSSRIAALTGGGYVLTWIESSPGGFSAWVMGELYDANGNAVGAAFAVSTISGIDSRLTVTALANGGFLVAWQWQNYAGGSSYATYARVFNAAGVASAMEFALATDLGSPASATLPDGRLILAYLNSQGVIEGQFLDAAGSLAGSGFQISKRADGTVGAPAVATLADGRFVVAWTASTAQYPVLQGTLKAQIFRSGGARIGSEFQINAYAPADYLNSSDGYGYAPSDVKICALADGRFLVTWTDWSQTLGDTSNSAVHGQIFTADGVRTGQEFLVNTQTAAGQIGAQAVALPDGTFIVTFEDDSQANTDTSGGAVRSQVFNPLNYLMSAADAVYYGGDLNDVVTQGPGNETLYGGGGTDAFIVHASSSQVQATIDAAGDVVVVTPNGTDTLAQFSVIDLKDATLTISGETLTETLSSGAKVVTSFGAAGELLSTRDYNASGALTGLYYTSQIPNNFTASGRSDILFAQASGALVFWQMNDAVISGGGGVGAPGAAWTYQGEGDFNGDGYSDVLWRNQNGQFAIWEMRGTAIVGGGKIGNPGGTWSVLGTSDFYGNGFSDILFQDASGELAIWAMNGTSIAGSGVIGKPGANYRLVGTGDFNGDGRSDLLFENASGQYAIWNLNGTAISGSASLGSPGAGWVYKGIGNFDGLGDGDILFQNANTGQYATWDVRNDAIAGGGVIGNPGPSWTLAAIGDYATTGRSSLLFQNTASGQLTSWDLDDTAITGGGPVGNPGSNYAVTQGAPGLRLQPAPTITFINSTSGQIAEWDIDNTAISGAGLLGAAPGYTALAVGDFNGDGQSDVLFSQSGAYSIWEANGTALIGGGLIGSPGSTYAYKGVGDFNGDGKSDILFKDASGNYATWDLSGTQIVGGGALGNPGAGRTYVGSGDFTGEGTSDLLFTDAAGNDWISFVAHNQIIATSEVGNPGAGYALAGVGDLNGDGKADLLFSKAGALTSWDLNGATIVGGGAIGNPGAGWTVAGVADLGPTNHASIVFDNAATGQVASWLMNDTSIIGASVIGTAAGYSLLGVR